MSDSIETHSFLETAHSFITSYIHYVHAVLSSSLLWWLKLQNVWAFHWLLTELLYVEREMRKWDEGMKGIIERKKGRWKMKLWKKIPCWISAGFSLYFSCSHYVKYREFLIIFALWSLCRIYCHWWCWVPVTSICSLHTQVLLSQCSSCCQSVVFCG
jgi:hypothetical protein